MNKYLEFKQIPYEGKTKRFEIMSKLHGYSLGRIMWSTGWRRYIFCPAYPTDWSIDCLQDIQDFLQSLMDERKYINKKLHQNKINYMEVDAEIKLNG